LTYGYDPLLTPSAVKHVGAIPLAEPDKKAEPVIIAGAHKKFREIMAENLRRFMKEPRF
jgi:hypothetical protein